MQFALVALALASLAVATPTRRTNGGETCNSGSLQCCESVQDSKNLSPSTTSLLGLLGVVVQGLTAGVGLTCDPITVIGLGGTSCSQQTVCCTGNNFNGVVALGCTPVNVAL